MPGSVVVHPEHSKAANNNSHFRSEAKQLRAVDQQFFGRDAKADREIVAKAVDPRFKNVEALDVGLFLRGVGVARA